MKQQWINNKSHVFKAALSLWIPKKPASRILYCIMIYFIIIFLIHADGSYESYVHNMWGWIHSVSRRCVNKHRVPTYDHFDLWPPFGSVLFTPVTLRGRNCCWRVFRCVLFDTWTQREFMTHFGLFNRRYRNWILGQVWWRNGAMSKR